MSSSSASSSPSPSPSPSPPPPKSKKRKQQPIEEVESSDSSSDSEGGDVPEAGDDADATVTAPSERESSPEVISHAERRKRKKQEKKAVKDSADADSPRAKKRKGEDGAAVPASKSDASNGKLKRQNSVWVGNMSFQSTPDSLRVFFDGVGEITRIHMPMKPGKGENMGFAYVDFSSPDAKIIAIALSERPLEGRNLLIKDGTPYVAQYTTY
ncbi:hypothetical protein CONPUDRAFT_64306 [Coniophora puteana RWD-64-598 SS2]|uniref:RRM domain-containing protein n=1 Tax=Coniophora puteana (strain RWD-64-598) TaxID=741705 RepID=A0A5M3MBI7_CONPW|nr:uncharacterized protein CONPUDRAFT_64306 [Coniophora puteana RWD-64-598 SS2]EIW76254.1 hypothetical protein CONPUDRAFT_64306 [Coniophora puteana RWD-64-598 SS2]